MPIRAEKVLLPEEHMALILDTEKIPYLRQFRFHDRRRWRVDFAIPAYTPSILLEVEGGVWKNGRHSRGSGFEADIEKYTEAVLMGYSVLRVTPRHIANGQALSWLVRALERKGREQLLSASQRSVILSGKTRVGRK